MQLTKAQDTSKTLIKPIISRISHSIYLEKWTELQTAILQKINAGPSKRSQPCTKRWDYASVAISKLTKVSD